MNHSDFSIGLEFRCSDKRWRCTDVGTRVIVAISLEPREMEEVNEAGEVKRFLSNDPRDLYGPPYGVLEYVFDEFEIEGCTLEPENGVTFTASPEEEAQLLAAISEADRGEFVKQRGRDEIPASLARNGGPTR